MTTLNNGAQCAPYDAITSILYFIDSIMLLPTLPLNLFAR